MGRTGQFELSTIITHTPCKPPMKYNNRWACQIFRLLLVNYAKCIYENYKN